MDRINEAFQTIKRTGFLPAELRWQADQDAPITIGYGQTNSQPSTVRRMLEWLDAQPGDTVLDVGAGSGWTAALLANLVGKHGFVYATEIVPELVRFGRDNCRAAGVDNVEFMQAGSKLGRPENSPYDRILVSAAAKQLPEELVAQLKNGGRMVIPVGGSINIIDKTADGYRQLKHDGFVFVPLVQSS